jgi:hypothetical protein
LLTKLWGAGVHLRQVPPPLFRLPLDVFRFRGCHWQVAGSLGRGNKREAIGCVDRVAHYVSVQVNNIAMTTVTE